MFTTFVVQPIFNLLVLIYSVIPGHNFGLAIIIFTIVIRLLMWPLVKKQLRQTKITRKLQPELKRIKKEAAGDKQKESKMMMELYKERGVNPFGTLPILVVQMIVLIGLYSGLVKVIRDPQQIVQFAYAPLQHLSWLQNVAANSKAFDNSLFGLIDLSRAALSPHGVYVPALILVMLSATTQFLSGRQLMPTDKDARKLRHILKDAGDGKKADQSEVNAAVSRSTMYILPVMILLFTINIAAALSLYWFTGGLVAYLQQRSALKDEGGDMIIAADEPRKGEQGSKITISNIPEAEIVTTKQQTPKTKTKKHKSKKKGR
jgi:YidC/Oxa1 family membrane protein insertase